MTNDLPSPERHAQGWRLVSREAHSNRGWINASGADPSLLLVLDTRGDWWAVAPACRHCAAPLEDALGHRAAGEGADELHCRQCGAAHGPAVAGCKCIALVVVDDEIYAAPDIPKR